MGFNWSLDQLWRLGGKKGQTKLRGVVDHNLWKFIGDQNPLFLAPIPLLLFFERTTSLVVEE